MNDPLQQANHLTSTTLEGKSALVTGASGNIGGAIATKLAAAGAAVMLHGHQRSGELEATKKTVITQGGQAFTMLADLSREEEISQLVEETQNRFGGLDILINNAGLFPSVSLKSLTQKRWQSLMALNLDAAALLISAASPLLAKSGSGAIVNIASIEAHIAFPEHAHYAAAKAGLLALSRNAALELSQDAIRVNSVSPGLIDRPGLSKEWPEGVAQWIERSALGRLGRADEVAEAVLFLASSAARWITGIELVVDGGVVATS
ncbi:MAG TPA: SDR family oxidoreductase [Arenicellales bacterium]|nr:SDR family oxidoreductase [Arenicellales bacterium]